MNVRHNSGRSGEDRVLSVEAGQVMCPRQGIVDVERCWICPAYGGLSTGRIEGVVCKADLADPRIHVTLAVH
jgi:hypothetical protein